MNYLRILRVSNILLILCGYQLHWFETKSRHFRLSVAGLANFTFLTILYLMCFGQHFETSGFLLMMQNISNFLHGLMHIQLLLGLKVFIFALYELSRVIRAANALVEQLPNVYSRKFTREEAYAYLILSGTLLVGLIYGIYIAYEMKFKLPPLEHCLIFGALFIPHMAIAGALRFHNIGYWLVTDQLERLDGRVADELAPTLGIPLSENNLLKYQQDLDTLNVRIQDYSKSLQRQLCALLLLNFNCLLAGVYIFVYYYNFWYVIFQDDSSMRRVFYAGNSAIFVCIASDYLGLLLTQKYFHKTRGKFLININMALDNGIPRAKPIRKCLKLMRNLLEKKFEQKFFGFWHLNIKNFLLLHIIFGIIIAICVHYQYLNDQLVAITMRLDSDDE